MKTDAENWSYSDFLTLLFIHIASSDFDLTEDEHDVIVQKVGEEEYKKIVKIYVRFSDYEVAELLSTLGKKYCGTEEQKEMAFEDMKEIIHVNGHKSLLEENMFRVLKKIL